jgi:endonuclease YncB( thermonuclease family)
VELISLVKADKFGRCLARIVIDGEDLAEFLLENGYAKPYPKKTIVKKILSFLGFKKNEN